MLRARATRRSASRRSGADRSGASRRSRRRLRARLEGGRVRAADHSAGSEPAARIPRRGARRLVGRRGRLGPGRPGLERSYRRGRARMATALAGRASRTSTSGARGQGPLVPPPDHRAGVAASDRRPGGRGARPLRAPRRRSRSGACSPPRPALNHDCFEDTADLDALLDAIARRAPSCRARPSRSEGASTRTSPGIHSKRQQAWWRAWRSIDVEEGSRSATPSSHLDAPDASGTEGVSRRDAEVPGPNANSRSRRCTSTAALVAQLQRPRAAARRGPLDPAPRAGQVRGDLQEQPRRAFMVRVAKLHEQVEADTTRAAPTAHSRRPDRGDPRARDWDAPRLVDCVDASCAPPSPGTAPSDLGELGQGRGAQARPPLRAADLPRADALVIGLAGRSPTSPTFAEPRGNPPRPDQGTEVVAASRSRRSSCAASCRSATAAPSFRSRT